MKKFLNEGLPLESGIRAALRHHRDQLKRYKVRTDNWLKAGHLNAVDKLDLMQQQFSGRGSKEILAKAKKLYLDLKVAKPELLGLVPAEFLTEIGSLNIEAARRRDVLDLILYDEKA